MIRLYILLSIFALMQARAQPPDRPLLQLQILGDSVFAITNRSHISVPVLSSNGVKRNLILYGFESNLLTVGFTPENLCDSDEVGAGIGVLIYGEDYERKYASLGIPSEIAYTPLSKHRFERSVEESRKKFLSGTKVLNAMDTSVSKICIPVQKFHLKKGTYWIQLIYYAGKNVVNSVVGEAKAKDDRILFDADIFEGCATSNRVKLIVY